MDDLMEENELSSEYMRLELEIEGSIRVATSATAASADASRLLSSVDGDRFQPVLAEAAAIYLLSHWGDRARPSDRSAIERATTVLIERKSPEAGQVWAGLQVVGDGWTADQRLAAAEGTLAAIDAAGLKRCVTCEASGNPFALSDAEAEALFGADADEQQREAEALGRHVVDQTTRRDAAVRALEEIAG
jgi:hypothetical protein